MDFDDNCSWPRRLLHVPTMTSMKWKPENKYGAFNNPSYNAVSYTWGRWELRDSKMHPEIKALAVRGVKWPIPRVHPDRFSVQEFQTMVNDTMAPHPSAEGQKVVEFLWLDVACIDQQDHIERDREVGRQARIFRGACNALIWLKHTDTFTNAWAPAMEKQFGLITTSEFHAEVDLYTWATSSMELIKELTADPWFSSLWTLQEAFLCPNAQIILRNAGKNALDFWSLKHICELLLVFIDCLNYDDKIRKVDKETGLSQLIYSTGLLDCLEGNPMGLLMASRNRTATYEDDRVYGIMQVFGLQLGKSAPDAKDGCNYSLEELADQLGEALLIKDPVLSQLHQHTSVVESGKAWRFSDSSIVPHDHAKIFFRHMSSRGHVEYMASLSTTTIREAKLGTFRGPSMIFTKLASRLTKDWPGCWTLGDARLMLDGRKNIRSSEKDYDLSTSLGRYAWLVKHKPETMLVLLGLKQKSDLENSENDKWDWAVGLLLSPGHNWWGPNQYQEGNVDFWSREGVFIWNVTSTREAATASREPIKQLLDLRPLPHVTKVLPYLTGDDPNWMTREGLFG